MTINELLVSIGNHNQGHPENTALLLTVLTQLERYLQIHSKSQVVNRKGKELGDMMDASLKIVITLLENIDLGDQGIDDKLSADLRKIYEKYLGTYKV